MQFFVRTKDTRSKMYVALVANYRSDLRARFPSGWFYVDGVGYHINEVIAEAETDNVPPRAALGGLIGILAGPIGVGIGLGIGALRGRKKNINERDRANIFNNSI